MKISEELQACLEVSGWKGEERNTGIAHDAMFFTREANGEREVLFQNITGNLVYASPIGCEVVSVHPSLGVIAQTTIFLMAGAIDIDACRREGPGL